MQQSELPPYIVDTHTYVRGGAADAYRCYLRSARELGVTATWAHTPLHDVEGVYPDPHGTLALVAVHDLPLSPGSEVEQLGEMYRARLLRFRDLGAAIAKIYRAAHVFRSGFYNSPLRLTSSDTRRTVESAAALGMRLMFHVGDPVRWFSAKYSDSSTYGNRAEHFSDFRALARNFQDVPMVVAHMGGNPEDLRYLDRLLTDFPHVYLNTSAVRWMLGALGVDQPPGRVRDFFMKWARRVMFGSDVVMLPGHLRSDVTDGKNSQAASPEEAAELYRSRLVALIVFLAGGKCFRSPVYLPDYHWCEPRRYPAHFSPKISGLGLDRETLDWIFRRTAEQFEALDVGASAANIQCRS